MDLNTQLRWPPTDSVRLRDRAIVRNLINYRKEVFFNPTNHQVWIKFKQPATFAFRNTISGIKFLEPFQPVRILYLDEVSQIISVSFAGESLKDLCLPTSTAKMNFANAFEKFSGFLASLPPITIDGPLFEHPYLNRVFAANSGQLIAPVSLYTKFREIIQRLKAALVASNDQITAGIVDPSLSNIALSTEDKLSIIDLDHYTCRIPLNTMLGFFFADYDIEAQFQFSPQDSYSSCQISNINRFIEGMLARLSIELLDPLIVDYDRPEHLEIMFSRLEWLDGLIDRSAFYIQSQSSSR